MINIENVTKKFGDKIAVDDISCKLNDGEIIGYIGPNGAGKTTTLKMICGIMEPDNGSITLNGKDISKEPMEAKRTFGFIPDNPDVFLALKGREYVNFICNIYDVPMEVRDERLTELLRDFEMEDAIDSKIESYSHGMRQKIHIVATLMHDPDIWIMDEPMTGLDPRSAYLLKERMRIHAEKGNTVLFSTHVLDTAERLCDRIIIIDKGKIRYNGTLEALKDKNSDMTLEEIFLSMTGALKDDKGESAREHGVEK